MHCWLCVVGSLPSLVGDAVLCEDITTKTKNHFKHILAPLQKPIVTNYKYLGVLESCAGGKFLVWDCWTNSGKENMGVSKNNGIPKSSILIGFSIINHPFWGTPIFGNTHIPLFTPLRGRVRPHQGHKVS